MTNGRDKILQYLDEAHAHERALVSVLTSQIAMTPRGAYRSALETHLRETRDHAERVGRRRKALGGGTGPLGSVVGLAETIAGQALALTKTPLDLVRGSGGEEKVLKNAKDACATEALEIATYTALERLARVVGDTETADLAASIRADEEKMLERITRELPKLTDAVVRADVKGEHSFDITETGAADAARATGRRRLDRPQDDRDGQAAVAPGPQGPGRRPRRGRRQGRRRLRGRPRDRPLRLAQRRRDHRQAREPVADRARQGRRLRAQEPEPHDHHRADLHLCRATSRGPATTSSPSPRSRPSSARATSPGSSRSAPTSARTRTAPACSRPPSARPPTRSPRTGTAPHGAVPPPAAPGLELRELLLELDRPARTGRRARPRARAPRRR